MGLEMGLDLAQHFSSFVVPPSHLEILTTHLDSPGQGRVGEPAFPTSSWVRLVLPEKQGPHCLTDLPLKVRSKSTLAVSQQAGGM